MDEQHDVIRKGLPGDWADVARGPASYRLREGGWRELMVRYAGMGPAPPLDQVFRNMGAEEPTATLAQLESGYIDEDFRDEYINFYAKTYRELPSRCERLHFFDDAGPDRERYLGYVVLRPIIGRPVCRTMLRPPARLDSFVSCRATSTATPWGYRKHIQGFPFISQDAQFGSCAHAALWMIGLYFHLRYRRPRFHLSDLARRARVHQDVHPAVPSGGLTPRQISAVLHDLDMTPVIYRLDTRLPDSVESIACRYLNSALPVMLLTEGQEAGHAQVLIGYGRDERGLFFVHHDDQVGPYQTTRHLPPGDNSEEADVQDESDPAQTAQAGSEEDPGREARSQGDADPVLTAEAESEEDAAPAWHCLIVPMPGRVFLSGEAAEEWGRVIFEQLIDDYGESQPELGDLAGGLDEGRLRLRSYLTEVADYKRELRFREIPDDVVIWHSGISTSHWLGIIELQDRAAASEGRRCVLGEVAIDATSDEQWANPLFGNLPGLTVHWPSLGDDIEIDDSTQNGTPYLTGCAVHVPS